MHCQYTTSRSFMDVVQNQFEGLFYGTWSFSRIFSFRKRKHKFTETERSSAWQSWSSLEPLKTSFNVPSDDQGSQLADLSISVFTVNTILPHGIDRTLAIMQPILTHLFLDKMAAISQTMFLNAFSWMKSFVLRFEFHWGLFLRAQLAMVSIGSGNGLVPNRRQAITWTNVEPVHWRIYAALGGDEFKADVGPPCVVNIMPRSWPGDNRSRTWRGHDVGDGCSIGRVSVMRFHF